MRGETPQRKKHVTKSAIKENKVTKEKKGKKEDDKAVTRTRKVHPSPFATYLEAVDIEWCILWGAQTQAAQEGLKEATSDEGLLVLTDQRWLHPLVGRRGPGQARGGGWERILGGKEKY